MIDKDVIVFFFKSKMIKNGQNPGNYSVFSSVVLFNWLSGQNLDIFHIFSADGYFYDYIWKNNCLDLLNFYFLPVFVPNNRNRIGNVWYFSFMWTTLIYKCPNTGFRPLFIPPKLCEMQIYLLLNVSLRESVKKLLFTDNSVKGATPVDP